MSAPPAGGPPTGLPAPLPPPEPRRADPAVLLVAAAVVLLALVVGGVLLFQRGGGPPVRTAAPPLPSSPATPSPSTSGTAPTPSVTPSASPSATPDGDALTQAKAQDALLDRTAQSKDAVGQAVTALSACSTAPAAAQDVFVQAAAGRRSLLTELGGLDLSALPEGTVLRTELGAALQASSDADDAFARWAQTMAGGCVVGPNADLARGLQLSTESARPAKERFVAAWDPVAARFGLAARTADQL